MNKTIKKTIIISAAIVCLMGTVLVVDIYRSMPHTDEHTVAMARIDFGQDITQPDADKISEWLYAQPGVSHVLCNPDGDCVAFTYYPVKADASEVAIRLGNELPYTGKRYLPTEADMAKGCPVSPNSLTFKLYTFFKNII